MGKQKHEFAMRTQPSMPLFLTARFDKRSGKFQLITMRGNGWIWENVPVAVNVVATFLRASPDQTCYIFAVFHGPDVHVHSAWGNISLNQKLVMWPMPLAELNQIVTSGIPLFCKDLEKAIRGDTKMEIEQW